MKLIRAIAFILLFPLPAFAECASGYVATPVCQLTTPVITSPLTLSCQANVDCQYQATAIGNPIAYSLVDGVCPNNFQAFTVGQMGLVTVHAGPAGATCAFTIRATSSTGFSDTTITVTLT